VKGIVLAGGSGTRLWPLTLCTSKQLLPVYDKPMIYYPLSVLMLAGIRDILIITTPDDQERFRQLLGDGSRFGVRLSYVAQPSPQGLAQAFLLDEDFIGDGPVTLILGDNMFYGHGFDEIVRGAASPTSGATIFTYHVNKPQRYGVVVLDADGKPIAIDEKPEEPRSNLAVTGLYVYDNDVVEIARSIRPSARGELEITDVNRAYMERGDLRVQKLGRGVAWLDTGTPQALLEASEYVRSLERRQGLQIACLEEIGYRNGWIDRAELRQSAERFANSDYGKYLAKLLESEAR
tara:strand:+ start:323 stop:1198 length:876 start_codon:yes stop_codon:yes gene_type:complete